MTEMTPELRRLGDDLEAAAARDLARRRRAPRRGRLVLLTAGIAVLAAGGAYAATQLVDEGTVAASLPAGTFALAGTNPTCTVVREGIEYRCVLENPPAPEVSDWKGTVEPTVDATSHVNGGCRSLNSAGTEWSCYLGEEAVRQEIIGAGFLGEPTTGPGRG
jgi:hypothetical protein